MSGGFVDAALASARMFGTMAGSAGLELLARRLGDDIVRFRASGYVGTVELSTLSTDIGIYEKILSCVRGDHDRRTRFAGVLGVAYLARFHASYHFEDLDSARRLLRECAYSVRADVIKPLWMGQYAMTCMLLARYKDQELLEEGVKFAERAVRRIRQQADAPPGFAASIYMNCASVLLDKFQRTGDHTVLIRAVKMAERGTSFGGEGLERAYRLSTYVRALAMKVEMRGSVADARRAVDAARELVANTPASHIDRPLGDAILAGALVTSFGVTGSEADLLEANDLYDGVLRSLPREDPRWATTVSWSTRALDGLNHLKLSREVIDRSVERCRSALAATPEDHPAYGELLNNLAVSLAFDSAKMDESIKIFERACSLAGPNRGLLYLNAASVRYQRFERDGDKRDLDHALADLGHVVGLETASVLQRLAAAWLLAERAEKHGRRDAADRAFRAMIDLLPLLAWRGLDDKSRRQHLARWQGAARYAAAYVTAESPQLAVEYLERGRSVLWGQVSQLRVDLTRLADATPKLAQDLEAIRTRLDLPTSQLDLEAPAPGYSREDLARRWDETVQLVRAEKGFENFLKHPEFGDLASVGDEGPVVILNPTQNHTFAYIIHHGTLSTMTLGDANENVCEAHASELHEAAANYGADNGDFALAARFHTQANATLEWLGKAVARPVLEHLGLATPIPSGRRPRIWWCPTGPMARLPIHAATLQSRGSTVSALDCVTSSYVTTLTSLLRGRAGRFVDSRKDVAVVGMPRTPGKPGLPYVGDEVDDVCRLRLGGPPPLIAEDAKHADVLALMRSCQWIHVSCHSGRNADEFGLSLHDGALSVTEAAVQRTRPAQAAVLLACSTWAQEPELEDESLNLASGFQLSGYRDVVGTMWPASDYFSRQVTTLFYEEAMTSAPSEDLASRALNEAVRRLRASYPQLAGFWAPFVHLGP